MVSNTANMREDGIVRSGGSKSMTNTLAVPAQAVLFGDGYATSTDNVPPRNEAALVNDQSTAPTPGESLTARPTETLVIHNP